MIQVVRKDVDGPLEVTVRCPSGAAIGHRNWDERILGWSVLQLQVIHNRLSMRQSQQSHIPYLCKIQ